MTALSSFARPVNLYEQPNANSKLVETVDSNDGIITIYTPKEGEWIKVANPRNGNVGWIKSSDFSDGKFSVNFITTGDNPKGYQIIQFGNTHLTTEQMKNTVKQLNIQQQNMQKEIQKMMQNILSNSQWRFPLVMPVVVVPEKEASVNATATGKVNDAAKPTSKN